MDSARSFFAAIGWSLPEASAASSAATFAGGSNDAVGAFEDWARHADLARLAGMRLIFAREQEIEELIGAAEFHIGAHRNAIVRLHDRIEKFVKSDRRPGSVPEREIVA